MQNYSKNGSENSNSLWDRKLSNIGFVLLVLLLAISLSPLAGILILWWCRKTNLPHSEIGLAKPKSWLATVVGGIVTGIVLKILVKAAIVQLTGANPVNESFHFLYQNTNKWLLYSLLAIPFAGFGEEIVCRGFLFQRLKAFVGDEIFGKIIIVSITALIFGLPHYLNQGLDGAINGIIAGILFGVLYFLSGKNLWYLMITHSAWDIFSFTIIYLGWEEKVSRLFF